MPGSNLSLEISKIFLLYSRTWVCAFSVRSGLNLLKNRFSNYREFFFFKFTSHNDKKKDITVGISLKPDLVTG